MPTYKDWDRAKLCIDALYQQTADLRNVEIILVNNDPNATLPEWTSKISSLICITEGKPGSYSARNAGARRANGDIFAFTDSDCIPSSNWIEVILESFSNRNLELLSGKVQIIAKDQYSIRAIEAYDIAVGIRQDVYAKKGTAATANLVCRRNVFASVGGFDEERLSGGDTDFCKRLRALGVSLTYAPSLLVLHPARSSWSEIAGKARRLAGSRATTKGKEFYRFLFSVLMPPVVRAKLIITCSNLSFTQKLKALLILISLKFVQVVEFFNVLVFGKQKVR